MNILSFFFVFYLKTKEVKNKNNFDIFFPGRICGNRKINWNITINQSKNFDIKCFYSQPILNHKFYRRIKAKIEILWIVVSIFPFAFVLFFVYAFDSIRFVNESKKRNNVRLSAGADRKHFVLFQFNIFLFFHFFRFLSRHLKNNKSKSI